MFFSDFSSYNPPLHCTPLSFQLFENNTRQAACVVFVFAKKRRQKEKRMLFVTLFLQFIVYFKFFSYPKEETDREPKGANRYATLTRRR